VVKMLDFFFFEHLVGICEFLVPMKPRCNLQRTRDGRRMHISRLNQPANRENRLASIDRNSKPSALSRDLGLTLHGTSAAAPSQPMYEGRREAIGRVTNRSAGSWHHYVSLSSGCRLVTGLRTGCKGKHVVVRRLVLLV